MSNNCLTLGSLFDGSGGFLLGGLLSGIKPVWKSEIEPFPIAVTNKRFPDVKHYGDVSRLNGAEIEPVDIITFGSPCQDMSIAGKRAGLDGSRSNLFYEAIRIVKEMRCATDGKYPRFICWENVLGAFSSNGGEDFKAVLESVCSVKGDKTYIPRPKKWSNAGEIVADNYSVAWRVLDAQYWGVPQRRKRIFLVADFAADSAGRILFESEGLSGYSAESFRSWQRTANGAAACSGAAGSVYLNEQGCGCPVDTSQPKAEKHRPSRQARPGTRPSHKGDGYKESGIMYTLNATEQHAVAFSQDAYSKYSENTKSAALRTKGEMYGDGSETHVYSTSKNSYHTQVDENIANTLVASDFKDPPTVTAEPYYIVRRLTPTECARLQGFPDWWCDGLAIENPSEEEMKFWRSVFDTYARLNGTKPRSDNQIRKWLKAPHTDSAEYTMWGNGVALPCVTFVLSGIVYYSHLTD